MSKSIVDEGGPSEGMGSPILLIVHHETSVLTALEADLQRRFGGDYRILARAPAQLAMQTLTDLSSRAEEVALVIAPERLAGVGGVEFMRATHELHPRARRVLLIGRGGYNLDHPAVAAMTLGQIDYYLFEPWFPVERWLFLPITELLADWIASRKPSVEAIRVVGEEWEPRSHALREVLSRVGIPHGSYSPASEVGRDLLEQAGQDGSRLPLVVFHTGVTLVDPSHADLVEALGFSTTASAKTASCQVAIVGAGPAGLAAAVYAASEGLRTVVVESLVPGGQAGTSSRIRNYLGFPGGISGDDLANRALEQARFFGANFVLARDAIRLRARGLDRIIQLSDGSELEARAVVIATGVSWRRLAVPSLEALVGAGVFYGAAATEARAVRDQDVLVVGAGNSAGQTAVHLSQYAASVTVLARGDSLSATMSDYLVREIDETANIRVRLGAEVVEGLGEGRLQALTLLDRANGARETVPAAALFVMIGAQPNTEWLRGSLARDDGGFLLTGRDLPLDGNGPTAWPASRPPLTFETSLPGVFAAGDVRYGSAKRVAPAVGGGAIAIQLIHEYLKEQE